MKTMKNLTFLEKCQIHVNAGTYALEHPEHVTKMIKEAKTDVPPSGSDMFKPELWKTSHWLWFHNVVY